jgi:hypothetical protein
VASFIRHRREGLLADSDAVMTRHTIELVRNTRLREEITQHNRAVPPALSWSTALLANHDAYAVAGAWEGFPESVVTSRRPQILVADP